MNTLNLDGKKFRLLVNSSHGQVTEDTLFEYSQVDNRFVGKYSDKEIMFGSIVGVINSADDINLVYHCILNNGQIKVGEASAKASTENFKIKLKMNWHWLRDGGESGYSEYLEI